MSTIEHKSQETIGKNKAPEERVREVLVNQKAIPTNEIKLENGAEVAVHNEWIQVRSPESPNHRKITIFMPGMPHEPEQTDSDGDHQEASLDPDLLMGRDHDFVVIKPEGRNAASFHDTNGNITSEHITTASIQQLKELFESQGLDMQDPSIDLSFVGLSEGAHQAASIASALLDEGVHVSSLVGVEPTGVIGYESPEGASVFPEHLSTLRNLLKNMRSSESSDTPKKPVSKTETGHHISGELTQSYDDILDGRKVTLADWIKSGISFTKRLATVLPLLETKRGIQSDRLKLMWSVNNDYERLLESNVPLSILSTSSAMIPRDLLEDRVLELREKHPDLVSLTSTDGSHVMGPSNFPKGFGVLAELKKRKKPHPSESQGK